MNYLEINHIKKSFGDLEVLKDISLTVKKGEINHENLLGSSLHVRQILQNITSNAVKYNKPNGKVILECRELPPKNEKAVFEFVCTDNGIGMSPEFQEHAFEPFVQENSSARTSYTGTGLGLAIVKKLVEQMEGTIHFVSEPGKGTRFTLVIPFLPDDSIEMQTEQTQSTDAVKGIENDKILLVEDYEINMEIARFVLENEGAQVQEAWNGKEAVDLFAASEPGGYDVILMDLMMPVMGGLEAAQCIRKLEREDAKTVPIIAMTANAFADDEERSLAAGMDAHISKPLDAKKYLPNGGCGVVSFGLKGGRAAASTFMQNLKLGAIETHVADARTCCLNPATSTHRQMTDEQLKEAGVPAELVRISLGLEDKEDLIADISQALDAIAE